MPAEDEIKPEYHNVYREYIMNLINSYEKDPEKQIQSVDEIKLEDFEYLP